MAGGEEQVLVYQRHPLAIHPSWGEHEVEEDDAAEKKVKKDFYGKKGFAPATVSTKKAATPDKTDETKKVGGDKAIQMKPAIKLVLDNK